MKSDLLALQTELLEVTSLIKAQKSADDLSQSVSRLTGDHEPLAQSAREIIGVRNTMRKYQYISVIVALYGAMEQYVESIISSYLRIIPNICGRYGQIPEHLRKKHHELTVEYLTAIKMNRVNDPEDETVVVRRLALCRNKSVRYEFNTRAFALRTANMSFDRMKMVLSNLGIGVTPRRLTNTQSYRSFYEHKNGKQPPSLGDAEARAVFSDVDNLVDRRNRVAHGANNVDDIEGPAILLERVEHLLMYARAIHEIVEDHVLRLGSEMKRSQALGVPLARFGASVVCFPLEGGEVAVEDTMVMIPTDLQLPARRGKIKRLEVDRASHDRIVGAAGVKFGAEVTFSSIEKACYEIVPAEIVKLLDS
ncbi:MAE_28990/MAE_18760 family HEPN-like nuclease (plasmid) [Segnochrobactraceae bacterium EtOH-i3]